MHALIKSNKKLFESLVNFLQNKVKNEVFLSDCIPSTQHYSFITGSVQRADVKKASLRIPPEH